MKKIVPFLCALFLFGLSGLRAGDFEPVYALVNCRVVTVSGPVLENGTIIIRDGLIAEVGPADKVAIPEDADVIDAEGLTAYPGLIDSHSRVFLETPREEADSPDASGPETARRGFHPGAQAFKDLKVKASDRDNLHRAGFTTVLVVPGRGIFSGQSVLLNVNGESEEAMVLRNPAALHVNFVTERGVYPSSLMGTMAALRQAFLDVDHYVAFRAAWTASPRRFRRPPYSMFLEALEPYVVGKKPVVFTCENQEDIKRAMRLADEFQLNVFLSGANEAWRVVDLLKTTRPPLFVALSFKPPATSLYAVQGDEFKKKAEREIYPANAALLHEAGIPFALTSYGLSGPAEFVKNVKTAIQSGLPREEAIKSLTLVPARFLGLENVLGSLEKGKIANVILTEGEIFEDGTEVRTVFADGRRFEVEKAPPAAGGTPGAPALTGAWEGKIQSAMGDLEIRLELVQEGGSVSGSVKSEMGTWIIIEGTLSGNLLAFTLQAVIMGQSMDLPFEGRVAGDSIEGSFSTSRGTMDVRLTKSPGC